jgi:DNA primase
MPAGDDPDTYLKSHGVEAFRNCWRTPRSSLISNSSRAPRAARQRRRQGRRADRLRGMLMLMSDFAALENQLNVVATYLQTSVTALRQEIARLKAKPQRAFAEARNEGEEEPVPVEPTPDAPDRGIHVPSRADLRAGPAFVGRAVRDAARGGPLAGGHSLVGDDSVCRARPEFECGGQCVSRQPARVRPPGACAQTALEGAPEDGMLAAEHALALLSGTVLQRRDAAVKAALKEPGSHPERMIELLEEAKEISGLLRGIGQRNEFDDELPASTFLFEQGASLLADPLGIVVDA